MGYSWSRTISFNHPKVLFIQHAHNKKKTKSKQFITLSRFSYYRSAHALILVYDISCQPTFDCLPDWLREIQEYANSKVLKILVGNKTDRDDREIPTAIGEEFAKQQGMYFLETSAKEAENVERLFYEIAAELIEQARTKEVRLIPLWVASLFLQFWSEKW